MPTNVTPEYQKAEKEYFQAEGLKDRLKCLQRMLSVAPSHKGGEKLRKEIKQKISRYKSLLEKEKQSSRGSGRGLGIKKECAAQVVILGKTNSGKSFLLSKITNANPLVAEYEYTTKKPEVGTMEYKGVPIQIIELPAITKNFYEKEKGPMLLSLAREAELIVILIKDLKDKKFIKNELELAGVDNQILVVDRNKNISEIKENIWKKLDLIYIFTKSPGKEKDFPPISLKKGANVRELASHVHKDFVKKFNFARIWGASAKHDGMNYGLKHKLKSGDIVELHIK